MTPGGKALASLNVSFGYSPKRAVLSEISLALRPGELLGMVGPNGAGKSTLLRIMAGLKRPLAGEVIIDNQNISAYSRKDLARIIGFLPQNVISSLNLTCREIVAQGRYPHLGVFGFLRKSDINVIQRCMEWTETVSLADRPLGELSGGERQRVLLASVLSQEATYLLLDEPTASLDIHHQVEVFSLLERLRESGLGIAVVTHDINLASQFCDRLALLSKGILTADGSPEAVLKDTVLSQIYNTPLVIERNPVTGKPLVVVLRSFGTGSVKL